MLTSPQTVTIDGVAKSLPRINQDNYGSAYRLKAGNEEVQLIVRHSYEGKAGPAQVERHNADLTLTTFDGQGNALSHQAYIIVRSPRRVDPVDSVNVAKALAAWITTNAAALGAWES